MERLADMHCHILPGVDDGPKDMETVREMLKEAYADGIRYIIATPHYHPARGAKKPGELRRQLKAVREEAEKIGNDLKIYLGSEIYFGQDVADELQAGEVLPMNRTQTVLLEFPTGVPFDYICQGIQQIQMKGYEVILAHIERYQCMYKDPHNAEYLVQMGVRIQVNAGSILGKDGWKAKRFVRRLLDEKLVFCVGSDAHDPKRRPPRMREAAEYTEKKYGEKYTRRIFFSNSVRMLRKKKEKDESGKNHDAGI